MVIISAEWQKTKKFSVYVFICVNIKVAFSLLIWNLANMVALKMLSLPLTFLRHILLNIQ